jgi:hypothetical protein
VFQTVEEIKIGEMKYRNSGKDTSPYYFNGWYMGKEQIGICTLNADRLIPDYY